MKKILFGMLISLLFSFSASAAVWHSEAQKVIEKGKILYTEKRSSNWLEIVVSYKGSIWWCNIVPTGVGCEEQPIDN